MLEPFTPGRAALILIDPRNTIGSSPANAVPAKDPVEGRSTLAFATRQSKENSAETGHFFGPGPLAHKLMAHIPRHTPLVTSRMAADWCGWIEAIG